MVVDARGASGKAPLHVNGFESGPRYSVLVEGGFDYDRSAVVDDRYHGDVYHA